MAICSENPRHVSQRVPTEAVEERAFGLQNACRDECRPRHAVGRGAGRREDRRGTTSGAGRLKIETPELRLPRTGEPQELIVVGRAFNGERPGRLLYRFTVNVLALLVPPAVVTVTLSLPNLAVAGTRHLIRVALQETYFPTFVEPSFTQLVPRAAPNPLPVSVIVTPRLAAVGDSLLRLGFGITVTVKLALLAAVPPAVVTEIVPLVAPPGTLAVIFAAEFTA